MPENSYSTNRQKIQSNHEKQLLNHIVSVNFLFLANENLYG